MRKVDEDVPSHLKRTISGGNGSFTNSTNQDAHVELHQSVDCN